MNRDRIRRREVNRAKKIQGSNRTGLKEGKSVRRRWEGGRRDRKRARRDGKGGGDSKMQKKRRWKKKRELISVNCSELKFAESVLSN